MAGAEFAILLAAPATIDDGRFLAGELIEAIGRPFVSGDHVITLGSRVGVAAAQAGDDPAALLRRASAALAEAKSGDGAPVGVLEDGAESATARGDRLEDRLAARARPGRDRDPLPAAGVGDQRRDRRRGGARPLEPSRNMASWAH